EVAERERAAVAARLRLDLRARGDAERDRGADEVPAALVRLEDGERDAARPAVPLQLDLLALRLLRRRGRRRARRRAGLSRLAGLGRGRERERRGQPGDENDCEDRLEL